MKTLTNTTCPRHLPFRERMHAKRALHGRWLLTGIARSDMVPGAPYAPTRASGTTKSQKVSWADWPVGILIMRLGYLTRMDKIRKLDCVLEKEHRHVVATKIEVAFVVIELVAKPRHIP